MGIPKFYRYISERWPLISQNIEPGKEIPEFDNLYLDMNSILHTCTHSNDDTLTRMTEEQVYTSIFAYIDHLFQTIKPKQTFYMAIDGVAPRAKMNQQRSRRFRTAIEAEKNLEKALKEGLEIPKDEPFDSNSITPGTEFMAKLTNNLKYFVHKKTSTDSNWQNIKIILSGHEVPGEGEHKIMEYIKTMKAQPNYNPNLRHCIYGLDADLIVLGLVSHDPHFALLREEVVFGRRSNKSVELESQNFNLLHLSLVREYLELEFQDLADKISFEYNFEKILDDFILIMYVIGNDFLPNLPDLFINKGAFPLLIETFKQSLKESDGYLNENGTINLKRLSVWLEYISKFELENFEKEDVDVEWFNKQLENISISGEKKRSRQSKLLLVKQQKALVGFIKPWMMNVLSIKIDISNIDDESIPTLELPTEEVKSNLEFIKKFAFDTGLIIIHSKSKDTYTAKLDVDGIMPNETDEEFEARVTEVQKTIKRYQSAILTDNQETLDSQKDLYDEKFMKWKDQYYKDKLGFSINDDEEMIKLTQNYIEGLQWVLYYYYKGCPSWNWYYKYHYAPRISDVKRGLDLIVNFDKGTPFKPFQQLMAVLPARSKQLIPAVYRPLMTDEKSPIIDFYPNEVEIDQNGKTAEWEAVVKISFVDQKRLVDVMAPFDEKLSPIERQRNSFGTGLTFTYNPQVNHIYTSPLKGVFEDLENDHCIETHLAMPSMEGLEIISGLPEGAKLGADLLAGFPSLTTLPFDYKLSLNGTVVFQQPSRSESVVLTLKNMYDDLSVEQFAQRFVGHVIYTDWPYLREAKVVYVVDDMFKYHQIKIQSHKKVVSTPLDDWGRKDFNSARQGIASTLMKTKGLDVGSIQGLVYVKHVTGLIRTPQGAYVKTFAKEEKAYPIQLVVKEVSSVDERFQQKPPLPIEEEYPLNSKVLFLGAFAYGSPADVVGYVGSDKVSVRVSKIQKQQEPNIGKVRVAIEERDITYYSSKDVCKNLRLQPLVLSKITSSYMIEGEKGRRINIGLELKFDGRRQKVLGFTRRTDRGWEYSILALGLIQDYIHRFPHLFVSLQNLAREKSIPPAKEIFKTSNPEVLSAKIKEVLDWLKQAKQSLVKVSLESDALTAFSLTAIEDHIEKYVSSEIPLDSKDVKGVPRNAILDPSVSYQLLSSQRFDLGDRVISVQDSGKVPYLTKGTVVGIISLGVKNSLEVIFDHPFISGSTMNHKLRTNRGLSVDSSLLLNLTNRQLVYHSKASKEKELSKKGAPVKHTTHKPTNATVLKNNLPVEGQNKNERKKKNELLSILHKETSNDARNHVTDNAFETSHPNDHSAQQVYGRVMSNYFGEHRAAPSFDARADPSTQLGIPVPVIPYSNFQATKELNSILHGVNTMNIDQGSDYSQDSHQNVSVPDAPNGDSFSKPNKFRGNFRGRGGNRGRGGIGRGSSKASSRGQAPSQ